MKSIATRLLVFSFAVLCVFSWTFSAVAVDITEQTTPTLDIITQINPDFEHDAATVTEEIKEIAVPDGIGSLVEFIADGTSVGYAILVDGQIVEFADHASPYFRFKADYSEDALLYDYATYSYTTGGIIKQIDSQGRLISDSSAVAPTVTIPGVTPQLQSPHLCGIGALANLFWYWKTNYFSGICGGKTFTQLKDTFESMFANTEYGAYSNNEVPNVVTNFLKTYTTGYSNYSYVYWHPSQSRLTAEINAGYPCLLGFSSSNPFYSSAHMTMCYGYYIFQSTLFVELADGHSTEKVTRTFGSHSDCIIAVHLYRVS